MSSPAPEYYPPLLLRNQHTSTIVPALLRKVPELSYARTRIDTPDGDFMDLDYSRVGSKTLLIAVHGLEGCSDSPYIRGLSRHANVQGWDSLAINMRSCSGEPNRLYSSYHSGKTDDLQLVLDHVDRSSDYDHLLLVGFSLGGNLSLKFGGEQGGNIHAKLRAIAAISVPTDLSASAHHLERTSNFAYMRRFLKTLKRKAIEKKRRFPDAPFTEADIRSARNFVDYDNLYTAPAHGFKDAFDYWNQCASGQFIPAIQVPTLIINALNDPFLPEACYPVAQSDSNPHVTLRTPKYGGHVGFATDMKMRQAFWHESQISEFFEAQLRG